MKKFARGDRVVVLFVIACGCCFFCRKTLFSACDTTSPNADLAKVAMGHSPAGLFGFSAMMGHYPGGQVEYLRVPHADVGPIKIESSLTDEQGVFLSDIFPTGYLAAIRNGSDPIKPCLTPEGHADFPLFGESEVIIEWRTTKQTTPPSRRRPSGAPLA